MLLDGTWESILVIKENVMVPMNPVHRNEANYVLEWFENAGEKIRDEGDVEIFHRFFKIGVMKNRWDYFTIFGGDKIIIGWNDISYYFTICDGKVQRVNI
jgi:hypothetical protein